MPPKKEKKQGQLYQQGTPFKDIQPEDVKQEPREGKSFKQTEPIEEFKEISNDVKFQSLDETHDWPGDEEALEHDFGLEVDPENVQFEEIDKWRLPKNYSNEKIIFRRRANEYLTTLHKEKLTKLQLEQEFKNKQKNWKKLTTMYQRRGTIEYSLDRDPQLKDVPIELLLAETETENVECQVFNIKERKETNKERKLRESTQVDQKKKKKGKDDDDEQEGPHMIKYVEYSNLNLSKQSITPYSKWIGSILQAIIDRNILDAYTGEPLWKKIYPQQDGVPVYNPSGRYWVKLYYMGKAIKIEIDDKIPIAGNQNIYIECENKNEIWPQLFSKAICKINRQKWENKPDFDFETLVGDGSVMYALTGLIPETMDVREIDNFGWEKIHQLLDDEEYVLKSSFMVAYSGINHQAIPPSNKVETKEEIINQQVPGSNLPNTTLNLPPTYRRKRRIKSSVSANLVPEIKETTISRNTLTRFNLPNFLLTGYAYSITEGFQNGQFNMVYVTKRSELEISLRQKLVKNTEMVQKNRFEMDKKQLVECKKMRKQLKQKINGEIRLKHKEMMAPPVQYNLLQVSSNSLVVQQLTVRCKYDAKEIHIAKKCIVNQLDKPPNFVCKEIRLDNRSVFSKSKKSSRGGKKEKKEKTDKDGDVDLDFTFEDMNVLVERKKEEEGVWMQIEDFLSCFHYIQIYHNPKTYKHYQTFNVQQEPEMEYIYNEEKQLIIIEKVEIEEKIDQNEIQEKEKSQEFSLKKMIGKGKKKKKIVIEKKESLLKFMFGFNRYVEENELQETPYFILQEFNVKVNPSYHNSIIQQFKSIQHFKTLDKKLDSELVLIENKSQIFKIQAVSKIPYTIWLASDCPFALKSFGQYMVEQKNFQKSEFHIEYSNLEKNKYNVFAILHFQSSDKPIEVFAYLSAEEQKFILKYFRIKIQKILKKHQPIYVDPSEGLILDEHEKTIPSSSQIHFILEEPGFEYKILIEGASPENIEKGEFDIKIYSSKNPNFESETESQQEESESPKPINLLELVEPLEYADIYKPYKYGVIFKERLFVNQKVHASIQLNLFRKEVVQTEEDPKSKKKEEKKMILMPMEDKRQLTMRIWNGEHLLYHADGVNKALISNIMLEPTTKENGHDYFIECKFDQLKWPEAGKISKDTEGICWQLDIFSTDNILVIKDTRQKEYYEKVISEWEEKEPGRAEKAQLSRQRYLLMKKQKRGEELTEEEQEILNQKRPRRGQEDPGQQKKAGKATKKQAKKAEEEVEEKSQQSEIIQRSEDHHMIEIKQFLLGLEDRDIKREMPIHQGLIKARSDDLRKKLEEECAKAQIDNKTAISANAEVREKITTKQKIDSEKLQAEFDEVKKTFVAKLKQQDVIRDEFRETYHKRIEIEEQLYELISKEDIQYQDIGTFLKEHEGAMIDHVILDLAIKVKTNLYLKELVEKIDEFVDTYNVIELRKLNDEIIAKNVVLNQDLIDSIEDMLYDAEGNENYQAEKLAEEKKLGKEKVKKGKKK